jgi:hypothetical protein
MKNVTGVSFDSEKAVQEELLRCVSEDRHEKFRIRVASNRYLREKAYRLAYQVYRTEGYIPENEMGMLVSPYDALPETLTLLAEDDQGRALGTITLIFDSPSGLPCANHYDAELNQLRRQHRQVVEVVRLAVDKTVPHSMMVILRLFNFIAIFARRVRKDTDFIIEANHHHAECYQRVLLFEPMGFEIERSEKTGMKAVLLRLDLHVMEREIQSPARRSIYSHAYTPSEEKPIARSLMKELKPMTAADAKYFGLSKFRTQVYWDDQPTSEWEGVSAILTHSDHT